jgi:hypothetical protein
VLRSIFIRCSKKETNEGMGRMLQAASHPFLHPLCPPSLSPFMQSRIEELEGKLQGQPAEEPVVAERPSHISWETEDHEIDFSGPVRTSGAPRRAHASFGGRRAPRPTFGMQLEPPMKRSCHEVNMPYVRFLAIIVTCRVSSLKG